SPLSTPPISLFSFFFSFHSLLPHRALHSFPTRRSSDLYSRVWHVQRRAGFQKPAGDGRLSARTRRRPIPRVSSDDRTKRSPSRALAARENGCTTPREC